MTDLSYEELLRNAGVLKLRGLKVIALGDEPTLARQAFLKAAAYELRALASLDSPDLNTVNRHLIEAMGCLKSAVVGTRWLPKLPNPRVRRG